MDFNEDMYGFPGGNDLSRIRVGLQFSDTFRVNIY